MFDLEQAKRASGLAPDVLARVERRVREDLPDDEMLFELHLIRTLQALKDKTVTLKQILEEQVPV